MGVRINPTEFQLATHVHRFKMLNALDVVWILHKVNIENYSREFSALQEA